MFDHFRFCLPKFCGCVPVDERDGRASEKYQKEFECLARNIATANFASVEILGGKNMHSAIIYFENVVVTQFYHAKYRIPENVATICYDYE